MKESTKMFLLTLGIFCELSTFPFFVAYFDKFKNGLFFNWAYAPTFVLLMFVWALKVWKAWREMRGLPELKLGFYVNPKHMIILLYASMIGLCAVLGLPILLHQPDLFPILGPSLSFILAISVLALVVYENKWYALVFGGKHE